MAIALLVMISGLIASGSIVFEPRAEGVEICKKRKILVIEGFMPQEQAPEAPSEDADCSSSSDLWTLEKTPSFHLIPNAPFERLIPTGYEPLDRWAFVEVPPPLASFFFPTKNERTYHS